MLYNIKYNFTYKHLYNLKNPHKPPSPRNISAKSSYFITTQKPPKTLVPSTFQCYYILIPIGRAYPKTAIHYRSYPLWDSRSGGQAPRNPPDR